MEGVDGPKPSCQGSGTSACRLVLIAAWRAPTRNERRSKKLAEENGWIDWGDLEGETPRTATGFSELVRRPEDLKPHRYDGCCACCCTNPALKLRCARVANEEWHKGQMPQETDHGIRAKDGRGRSPGTTPRSSHAGPAANTFARARLV